jgi:hypothetical protein
MFRPISDNILVVKAEDVEACRRTYQGSYCTMLMTSSRESSSCLLQATRVDWQVCGL